MNLNDDDVKYYRITMNQIGMLNKKENVIMEDNEMVNDDESVSSSQVMLDIKKWDSRLMSIKVTDEMLKGNSNKLNSIDSGQFPSTQIKSRENSLKTKYNTMKSDDDDDDDHVERNFNVNAKQKNDFVLSKRKVYTDSTEDDAIMLSHATEEAY